MSLVYIKALSVKVIAITIWFAIRRVKCALAGPLSRAKTLSLPNYEGGLKVASDNSRAYPVVRSYRTAPPDGAAMFAMA